MGLKNPKRAKRIFFALGICLILIVAGIASLITYAYNEYNASDEYSVYFAFENHGDSLSVRTTDAFHGTKPVAMINHANPRFNFKVTEGNDRDQLTIRCDGTDYTYSAARIENVCLSPSRETVFFDAFNLEPQREYKYTDYRVWAWNIRQGFHTLSRPFSYIYSLHMSLKEDYLAMTVQTNDEDPTKICVLDLNKGNENMLELPKEFWLTACIDENTFLISKHIWGSNEVYLWRPFAHEMYALDIGGTIVQATIFEGSIWAAKSNKEGWDVLRLNESLRAPLQLAHFNPHAAHKLSKLEPVLPR